MSMGSMAISWSGRPTGEAASEGTAGAMAPLSAAHLRRCKCMRTVRGQWADGSGVRCAENGRGGGGKGYLLWCSRASPG